jgi:hypothetical protein
MPRRSTTGRPAQATAVIGIILLVVGFLGTVAGVSAIGAQVGTWALILSSVVLLVGIFYTGA